MGNSSVFSNIDEVLLPTTYLHFKLLPPSSFQDRQVASEVMWSLAQKILDAPIPPSSQDMANLERLLYFLLQQGTNKCYVDTRILL